MKLGIILETKEQEKAWNALRFANTSLKREHEVKFFLMGEAVEIVEMKDGEYDIAAELVKFNEASGTLLACGTCVQSRQMGEFDACPISTMVDCVEVVEWADQVLTF